MNTTSIKAIDVHAHYGRYCDTPDDEKVSHRFMSADDATVDGRAQLSNIAVSVVSPLQAFFPKPAETFLANEHAACLVAKTSSFRQWVVINPLQSETYEQAEQHLRAPYCVGIKIHPEQHVYPIREYGRAIFEFAAKSGAVVLTHSGEENSMPEDYVEFLDDFPEVRLILAHLGCTCDDDPAHQVRAIQSSKHGNIFADTSSGQSLLPNLIEWGVREVGAEKLLFGTDTPIYHAPMMRARIDYADISDREKQLILRENALSLLNFSNEQ